MSLQPRTRRIVQAVLYETLAVAFVAPVLTLVPIPLALFVEVPAFVFIFVWFALQLVYGLLSTGGFSSGGVAWWAHIGGFLVGLFAILLHRKLLGGESSNAHQ